MRAGPLKGCYNRGIFNHYAEDENRQIDGEIEIDGTVDLRLDLRVFKSI